jgi:pSer/pThr/pTyr-binding forkhead associated (FHA) protein
MIAELVSADPPGCSIRLEDLPVTMGRGSEVELCLSDPYLSHYHCKIDQIGGTLVVRDLGSKNGTFVNGFRVTESHVMPGDKLTVGRVEFRAHYEHRKGAEHE